MGRCGTRCRRFARQKECESRETIYGSCEEAMNLPDARGYFGRYGGRFVPETLMEAVIDLEKDYSVVFSSASFQQELSHELKHFAGRPTPLYYAKRLSEQLQV